MKTQNKSGRLEKIINSVKNAGKTAMKFCKDNAKYAVMTLALGAYGLSGETAKAVEPAPSPGYLKVNHFLNSQSRAVYVRRDNTNFPATDGHDTIDIHAANQPIGLPQTYSEIFDGGLYQFWTDFRNEDSNLPYSLKFSFNGTLNSNQPERVEFSMPLDGKSLGEYHFGNKPVVFDSNRLPYGEVMDVKRAMAAQNNGVLDSNAIARADFIEVPAGTYTQWNPHASGILDIGTRILSDLDESGTVDMKDFSILAENWMQPQGKYTGDTSSENGIPDGFVNFYDLKAFSEDYLKDINDSNTW